MENNCFNEIANGPLDSDIKAEKVWEIHGRANKSPIIDGLWKSLF